MHGHGFFGEYNSSSNVIRGVSTVWEPNPYLDYLYYMKIVNMRIDPYNFKKDSGYAASYAFDLTTMDYDPPLPSSAIEDIRNAGPGYRPT
jgi:hypothetical protein